jgi:thioesterase domain-containing protein
MGPTDERHIVIHRRGTRQPLFWVQPAREQVTVLQELDRQQPVYCLYRLKPDPSRPPLTFAEIAAYHIETIRSLCPQGPYALVGYCICGTIAREMASQLRAQGETVSALIMIDPVDPAISRADVIQEPALFHLGFTFSRLAFHLQKTKQYSAKEKLAYGMRSVRIIVDRLKSSLNRRQVQTRGEAAAPLTDSIGEVHAGDMFGFINSVPPAYAGSAIILRPAISPRRAYEYPNRRWAQLISGGLDVLEVPGDSDSMWLQPDAKGMAERIDSCLAGLQKSACNSKS